MRRTVAALLALVMALGLAGCKRSPEGERPRPSAPAVPSGAPDAPAATLPPEGDERAILAYLGVSEEEFLHVARRAVAQAFDSGYVNYPMGEDYAEEYYAGYFNWPGVVQRRAELLARVSLDEGSLWLEGTSAAEQRCLYLPGSWTEGPLELDFGHTSPVSSVQSDGVVTAVLEDDRVFLSFTDSEEAAWYLTGGWVDDSGEDAPCHVDLELGPAHQYEVRGLWSNYTDMVLASLGIDYRPFLVLATEQGGVELVDILRCARLGIFCAMPVPGLFGSEPVELFVDDGANSDFGYQTVFARNQFEAVDLSDYAMLAQRAVPVGSWSAELETIQAEVGSYSRMGSFGAEADGTLQVNISELDAPVAAYDGTIYALGMTERGILCMYDLRDGRGAAGWGGLVYYPEDPALSKNELYRVLHAAVVAGRDPFDHFGEALTFYGYAQP